MARIHFTEHLARHVECPPQRVVGCTVREVLEGVFRSAPRLRGYVLDDQQRLRQHVVIFVDDQVIRDREQLSDSVREDSEVYVLQALSGG